MFVSMAPGETDLHFLVLRIGSMTEEIRGNGVDGKVFVANIRAGDINQDGVVDFLDACLLSWAYGSMPNNLNWHVDADTNGDGIVDIYDAITLAGNYGKTT